ncbi:MAG: non-heme iron oxygenase ferredoxin subunit [Acidimicrobiales bacterium]|nr:non-heme iron oxygenase ferredoxin subunit [Acidimicrobiales bacterium]
MTSKVKVCEVEELKEGVLTKFDFGKETLAVLKSEGEIYIVEDTCSHQKYSLSEGEVDLEELTVECPRHGAQFSLKTGEVLSLPATRPIKTYAAEIGNGAVWVSI